MLGKRIKKLRIERGMSLDDLAKRIGSSKSYVWELEKGRCRPSIDLMINFSKAFNVSIDFLATGEAPKDMVCRNVLGELIQNEWQGMGMSFDYAGELLDKLK